MATVRPLPPVFGLTEEQEKLYHSVVPRQVNRAAAHVIREYHVHQQEEDLKQEGTIAVAKGIPRFEPARETKFEDWAFFCALHAMLQIVRVEGRYLRLSSTYQSRIADGHLTRWV